MIQTHCSMNYGTIFRKNVIIILSLHGFNIVWSYIYEIFHLTIIY